MSILLEALRKSEKIQAPVEPPTIHTEQQISVAAEPIRKGPLAGLLLLAFLLVAWIVWRQYEAPVEADQPPLVVPAKQEGTIQTPVSSRQANDVAPGSTKSSKTVSTSRRTPVESYQPQTPATSKPVTSGSSVPGSSVPGSSTASPDTTGTASTKLQAPPATGANRRAVSRPAKQQPQPISYWELPDAVRADVPVMKFSVLVYASDPAARFVLVNGQRLVEGDSYQQGLVVDEIRRDGVVFSYRLYRFLIER